MPKTNQTSVGSRREAERTIDRRAVLILSAATAGALATAGAGNGETAPTAPPADQPRYVETPHISAFYERSRF